MLSMRSGVWRPARTGAFTLMGIVQEWCQYKDVMLAPFYAIKEIYGRFA